ncbi:hypothetical protein H6F89_28515 [Cyanobacteria bacterium FACHB-63]|nr:hypothetical protein [Cyanobacteria bacterium FACHB-63]
MDKKSFSARIDADLYETIAAHCQKERISQAKFLEDLARQFFQIPGETSAVITRAEFETQIESIRQEVQALKALYSSPAKPRSRESHLEGSEATFTELTNVSRASKPRATDDSQGSNLGVCPKCGAQARFSREGKGKLRRDGTRAQRWKCSECAQIFTGA